MSKIKFVFLFFVHNHLSPTHASIPTDFELSYMTIKYKPMTYTQCPRVSFKCVCMY